MIVIPSPKDHPRPRVLLFPGTARLSSSRSREVYPPAKRRWGARRGRPRHPSCEPDGLDQAHALPELMVKSRQGLETSTRQGWYTGGIAAYDRFVEHDHPNPHKAA